MTESPSSRRAWIEISVGAFALHLAAVALLAEGVDRNNLRCSHGKTERQVALLAEGVDRNLLLTETEPRSARRPPRGGRG